jgi:hypothetical protein
MNVQMITPQEKAARLVLFCMSLSPNYEKAKIMAKRIAKEMPSFAEADEERISLVLQAIDNLPKEN